METEKARLIVRVRERGTERHDETNDVVAVRDRWELTGFGRRSLIRRRDAETCANITTSHYPRLPTITLILNCLPPKLQMFLFCCFEVTSWNFFFF